MNAIQHPYEGFTDTPSFGASHRLPMREAGSAATLAPSPSRRGEAGSRGEPDEGASAPLFVITAETGTDVPAREALLDRAMGPKRKKKSSEKLRRGRRPAKGLAFVARDGAGCVVGTVRLWDVALGAAGWGDGTFTPSASLRSAPPPSRGRRGQVLNPSRREAGDMGSPALLLGPLAVDPALKGAGIGSALMRRAIAEAKRLGHRAILLVGDAPYYARFGFSAEKTGDLAMPGPYERERFLALELVEGALDGAAGTLQASGRKMAAEKKAA